jgi:hypothetical protein
MWGKVAQEIGLPWRAVEAMHWQLGEQNMARRAGVVPFSLSSVALDTPLKMPTGPQGSGPGTSGPAAAPATIPLEPSAEVGPADNNDSFGGSVWV